MVAPIVSPVSSVEDGGADSRPARQGPLPVTVLSGFLGAGKTSLLKHMLTNAGGLRIGALVNDMASVNIDGATVVSLDKAQEVVQLENGCICCTLRDSLLESVLQMSQNRAIDYCIIESTGVSEPIPVAEAFTFTVGDEKDADGNVVGEVPLSKFARLDTLVTVVDVKNFPSDFSTQKTARQRWGANAGDDDEAERNIAEILTDQLEFANVVILNKCDLVPEVEALRVAAAVRAFNVDAKVIRAEHSRVAVDAVMGTETFSLEEASQSKAWLTAMRTEESSGDGVKKEPTSELEEFNIQSAVYRRRRPFHPQRFAVACVEFTRMGNSLLRSKGFVWLATKAEGYGTWSQAGVVWTLLPGGKWMCATPREEWPSQDAEFVKNVMKDMHEDPEIGDRRQELVFIGQGLEKDKIFQALDACLLTDEEMKGGAEKWEKLVDPFGAWDFTPESDNEEDSDSDHDDQADCGTECNDKSDPAHEKTEKSTDVPAVKPGEDTETKENVAKVVNQSNTPVVPEKRSAPEGDAQNDTCTKRIKGQ